MTFFDLRLSLVVIGNQIESAGGAKERFSHPLIGSVIDLVSVLNYLIAHITIGLFTSYKR